MDLLVLIWLVILTGVAICEGVYIHWLTNIVEQSVDTTQDTLDIVQGVINRIQHHEEFYHSDEIDV